MSILLIQSEIWQTESQPSVDSNISGVDSLTVEVTMKGTGGATNLDIVNPELQAIDNNGQRLQLSPRRSTRPCASSQTSSRYHTQLRG